MGSEPTLSGHAKAPDATLREQFLTQREQVITDLTKCHDELTIVRSIVERLPSVYQFKETFTFQDALSFDASGQPVAGEPAVDTLKRMIARKVQEHADRMADHDMLERQFLRIKTNLIQQEQERCSEKVFNLCDRIDHVVHRLVFFPNLPQELPDLLRLMTSSLRNYAQSNQGQSSIALHGPNPSDDTRPHTVPLAIFFDQLDTLAVETLTNILDCGESNREANSFRRD